QRLPAKSDSAKILRAPLLRRLANLSRLLNEEPVWTSAASATAAREYSSLMSDGPARLLRTLTAASDIPLDPGNGGRSITAAALQTGDIILSTTAGWGSTA